MLTSEQMNEVLEKCKEEMRSLFAAEAIKAQAKERQREKEFRMLREEMRSVRAEQAAQARAKDEKLEELSRQLRDGIHLEKEGSPTCLARVAAGKMWPVYNGNAPKWDGKAESWVPFKRKLVPFMSAYGCVSALTSRSRPGQAGSLNPDPSVVRAQQTAEEIAEDSTAWQILMDAIGDETLSNAIAMQESPSEAWEVLEERFSSQVPVLRSQWRKTYNSTVMGANESVLSYLTRYDYARRILECLHVTVEEHDHNNRIIENLDSDGFELEGRTILRNPSLSRSDINKILMTREQELVQQGKIFENFGLGPNAPCAADNRSGNGGGSSAEPKRRGGQQAGNGMQPTPRPGWRVPTTRDGNQRGRGGRDGRGGGRANGRGGRRGCGGSSGSRRGGVSGGSNWGQNLPENDQNAPGGNSGLYLWC